MAVLLFQHSHNCHNVHTFFDLLLTLDWLDSNESRRVCSSFLQWSLCRSRNRSNVRNFGSTICFTYTSSIIVLRDREERRKGKECTRPRLYSGSTEWDYKIFFFLSFMHYAPSLVKLYAYRDSTSTCIYFFFFSSIYFTVRQTTFRETGGRSAFLLEQKTKRNHTPHDSKRLPNEITKKDTYWRNSDYSKVANWQY